MQRQPNENLGKLPQENGTEKITKQSLTLLQNIDYKSPYSQSALQGQRNKEQGTSKKIKSVDVPKKDAKKKMGNQAKPKEKEVGQKTNEFPKELLDHAVSDLIANLEYEVENLEFSLEIANQTIENQEKLLLKNEEEITKLKAHNLSLSEKAAAIILKKSEASSYIVFHGDEI